MAFVLDSSTTLAWAFADEHDPVASRAAELLQTDTEIALVPDIWWYEVRNTLLTSERRGRIATEDASRFLRQLDKLRIVRIALSDEQPLFALARQYRMTFYDAAYLALAIRERSPLATLDKQLAAAAFAEAVPFLS
jgi:predicted nucleic acid-binding protein